MAAVVGEAFDSRKQRIGWKNSTCEEKFIVIGTEDESAVREAAEAIVPATYTPTSISGTVLPTLILDSYELEPKGGGIWYVLAHYNQITPRKTNDSVYQFDTGGGTQKIFSSLNTRNVYPASGITAPNFGGLIGVTADGVEGCEVVIPAFHFSEVHYIPVASFTSSYEDSLCAATGTISNGTWRTYSEGEVLFLGASGQQRGQDDWELTFKFARSKNKTGLSIGPITGITKGGWDYLWIRYQDSLDSGSSTLQKSIMAVIVEQVYEETDFTTLGIGS